MQWAQQSIKNILEDVTNYQLAYTTHNDICSVFPGETLLAIQAPDGTQLEVPSPQQLPGRAPKYQIHLESGAGQIHVLLINKEHNSDPVVVEVPPPPEIAAALKREEGGDILSLAQTLVMSSSGLKRERQPEEEEEEEEEAVAGPGKRGRYEGESEPGSEEGYESSSEREISLELPPQLQPQVVPPTSTTSTTSTNTAGDEQDIEQEFNIPNIQTDIPGLEELISSESKSRRELAVLTSVMFQCSSDSVRRLQRRITATTWTTVKESVICLTCYNWVLLSPSSCQYLI